MTFATTAQTWTNFYLLTGGASATLTGLMFLAVTFGSNLVTPKSLASARSFVDPVFTHFVQVFFIACVFVVPTMTAKILGVLLLVMTAFRMTKLVTVFRHVLQAHALHGDIETSDWMLNIAAPGLCYVLLLVTGMGFILEKPLAFEGLAIFCIGILMVGVVGAWELLLWMATKVAGSGSPEEKPVTVDPPQPYRSLGE